MTDYEYDEKLPYVVAGAVTGMLSARFRSGVDAEHFASQRFRYRVIDTTPKPRVPDDAKYITWLVYGSDRWFAERTAFGWKADNGTIADSLEGLPGVDPDTVFTVLDERKNDD